MNTATKVTFLYRALFYEFFFSYAQLDFWSCTWHRPGSKTVCIEMFRYSCYSQSSNSLRQFTVLHCAGSSFKKVVCLLADVTRMLSICLLTTKWTPYVLHYVPRLLIRIYNTYEPPVQSFDSSKVCLVCEFFFA